MTESKNTAADKSESQEGESGVIAHEGILDLTGFKTPAELAHIRAIRHVGLVLVPEELTAELAKIPQSHVGAVIPVPTPKSGKLRLMTGQLKLSGDTFADTGGAHPNNGFQTLVWDKTANRAVAITDLFAPDLAKPA